MSFDAFAAQAWNDHATDAPAVAQRLADAIALVADEAQLSRLAYLGHHVHGAHLGEWPAAIAFVDGLTALPCYSPDGPSGAALRRYRASLEVASGATLHDDATLSPSDRIRVVSLAASSLVDHDASRAAQLLRDAVRRAANARLPNADPMHRDLAIAGNTLACALEEKPERSADERDLMILAAQTAREQWAIAGTWLETERAEYRLANTWLKAGDIERARVHARACLAIVATNEGAALERLFAWEVLGLVERAAGNAAGHAEALAQARAAFADLTDDDKSWCAASLEKLAT